MTGTGKGNEPKGVQQSEVRGRGPGKYEYTVLQDHRGIRCGEGASRSVGAAVQVVLADNAIGIVFVAAAAVLLTAAHSPALPPPLH